ncbi:MAG: hypothetical protein GX190_04425 [Mollicutes bacterium]|nr:hypothetical protein [Mollicutes bacterium]
MLYSILGVIGAEVSKEYKWVDTLILESSIAKKCTKEEYEKCKRFIKIYYSPKINIQNYREISKGLYISENGFYDREYGVQITITDDKNVRINTSQECNEWLIIIIYLLLIKENYLLIHSAGLLKDNNVFLLPSWGGVGKTACVAKMVREQEWNLLGDDIVAINEYGIAKPFLKDFVIYPYHKNLFPTLFKGNKKPIVPVSMNNFVSRMVPYIKPILRKLPGLLAFLRKNNPQSVKISPIKIFDSKYLGGEGKINTLIWLERVKSMSCNKCDYSLLTIDEIASKIISVSMLEIFSSKLNAICVLCGCGLIDFEDVFIKPYDILIKAIKNAKAYILKLPVSMDINIVPDKLLEFLENIRVGDIKL